TPVLAQEEATVDLTATVLTEDEPSLDLAKTNTNCPTCGPSAGFLVYFDQNRNGRYDPGEETRDRWPVLLYQDCVGSDCSQGPWTLFDKALTGGSDFVYDAGSDTGKAYFKGLPLYKYFYVCAEFSRTWLEFTEPIADPLAAFLNEIEDNILEESGGLIGGWNDAQVSVVENPLPLADDYPPSGGRNWDEGPFCYKIKLRSTCNDLLLKFGVFDEDTLLDTRRP
ncbi:MAG: hypothetical protein QG633_632, partial [Patescibacteria group bacterium]|nr:hypothetical protein [Patescibacteria group bacterium]